MHPDRKRLIMEGICCRKIWSICFKYQMKTMVTVVFLMAATYNTDIQTHRYRQIKKDRERERERERE